LLLPTDVVVADRFAEDAATKTVPVSAIPEDMMGLDIGPETAAAYAAAIADAASVFWNGPMGVFEMKPFEAGTLAVANAVPTAEGAVQLAMEHLPITIHNSRVLVIGFGRLGRALAPRLRALGARVWVCARRYEQRAAAECMGLGSEGMDRLSDWLCSYDLVFNTVPAPVLGVEELAALKEGALVIDLASRPGGVDLDAAAALGVRVVWALSLPGKVAPVTSGRYIKNTIYHIMEESDL